MCVYVYESWKSVLRIPGYCISFFFSGWLRGSKSVCGRGETMTGEIQVLYPLLWFAGEVLCVFLLLWKKEMTGRVWGFFWNLEGFNSKGLFFTHESNSNESHCLKVQLGTFYCCITWNGRLIDHAPQLDMGADRSERRRDRKKPSKLALWCNPS